MSYIKTSEGIVLNSMAFEFGRGGYTPASAATSEAQLTCMRGYLRAYEVTREGKYLTTALTLGNAYLKYFAQDTLPPSTELWANQWVVNGGLPFAIKGPVSPNGSDYDGYILEPKTVGTGGVVDLGSELANVYNVFTNGSTISWQNVFADLSTGAYVTWTEFWDKSGNRFTPSGYDSDTSTDPSKAGKLYTSATPGATVLVNYSVFIPSITIPYGDIFECWPMWRQIDGTVWNCAGDAIHWMIDAFDMLKTADSANVSKWSQCKSGALRLWYDATSPNVETYLYKKEADKRYSSIPGTYWAINQGGVEYTEPNNPTGFTIDRDDDGYVTAVLPAEPTRTDFQFWNEKLYLNYVPATSTLSFEVGATVDTNIRFIFWYDDNKAFQTMFTVIAGDPAAYTFPMRNLLNAYVWASSTGVVPPATYLHDDQDYCVFYIEDGTAGAGFPISWTGKTMTFRYKSTGPFTLNILGGTTHSLPASGTYVDYVIPETTGYGVQIIGTALNTITCTCTDVVYQGSDGSVSSCEIIIEGTYATTVKLGDVIIVGGLRDEVEYQPGALLFQTSSGENTVSVQANSGAPFQGPYYIGYQNPCPWFDQGYVTHAINMLQLISDAQDDYHTKFPTVDGPVTPVYNQNTWDAGGMYTPGFNWEGPDPNTFWGGWQYRMFNNVADYWQRAKAANQMSAATTLAESICERFVNFLINWIADNPSPAFPCLPTYFGETGDITVGYNEPHMIALALKGAIFSYYAAPKMNGLVTLIETLDAMLLAYQIQTGPMYGSFSPDPDNHVFYGYWAGEIMDAIALYARWKVSI